MAHNWSNDRRCSNPAWRRLRTQILERDGNRCQRCGAHGDQTGVRLELDHITPVAEGGQDSPENTQLLCHDCHLDKSKREALAGQRRRRARLRLPAEPHPGLRQVGEDPRPPHQRRRHV
ncbi:HNH endonuclease [Tsukamurella sp. DT100]|uniref:HNH endonuclease n=1 Tax=Tsukamurella sp. DT100 TaxID=3393415 RepID=UPI003CF59027